MKIESLLSNTHILITQTLEGFEGPDFDQIRESFKEAQQFWETLESPEVKKRRQSKNLKTRKVIYIANLIQSGELLLLLNKKNSPELDELTSYLINKMIDDHKGKYSIIESLEKKPDLYLNTIKKMIVKHKELFLHNMIMLLTGNPEIQRELGRFYFSEHYDPTNFEEQISLNYLLMCGAKVLKDPVFRKEMVLAISKYSNNVIKTLFKTLDKWYIEDFSVRKEVALNLARQEGECWRIVKCCSKLGITDPSTKEEIALALSKHHEGTAVLLENSKWFQYNDPSKRAELAFSLIETEVGARYLARHIQVFHFDEASTRKSFAFAISDYAAGAVAVARNFDSFAISDPSSKKEIAMAISKHKDGILALAENFHHFRNEEDEASREEMAQYLLELEGGAFAVAKNFNKFQIINSESKKEFAFAISQDEKAALALAYYFEEFGVIDLESKKEIVRNIFNHRDGPKFIAQSFHKFQFDDEPKFCQEMAFAISETQNGAEALAFAMTRFQIEDPAIREEIAFKLTKYKNGAAAVARNVKDFQIEDPHCRDKLARLIAQHNKAARILVENFESFNIEDSVSKKEILLLIAEHNAGACEIIHSFEKFGVEDPDFMKQFALAAARHWGAGWNLACNFEKFSIEDSESRREIARALSQQEGEVLLCLAIHFEKFRIEDSETRNEIAMKISKDPSAALTLCSNIQKFEIDDPELRKAIALEILKHENGSVQVAAYFDHFELSDPMDIKEVFRSLLKSCDGAAAFVESNLIILIRKLDYEFRQEVAIRLLYHRAYSKKTVRPHKLKFVNNILMKSRKLDQFYSASHLQRESLLKKPLQKILPRAGEDFLIPINDCIEKISLIEDPELQENLAHWLFYSHFILSFNRSKELWKVPFYSQILKSVYNVRDHDLRFLLIDKFSEQLKSLSIEKQEEFINHLMTPSHMMLTNIMMHDLKKCSPSIDKENAFVNSLKKRKRFLKDGEKAKVLYQAIYKLETSSLSAKQVNVVLTYFTRLTDKELLKELNALNAILSLQKEQEMVLDPLSPDHEQFIRNLSKIFDTLLPGLKLTNLKAFQEGFFEKRQPGALAVYVAGISKLSEWQSKRVLDDVKRYIEDVDQNCFHEKRYEGTKHLEKVFSFSSELKEKWKRGYTSPLLSYIGKSCFEKWTIDDSDDPLDLFYSGTEVGGSCQRVGGNPGLNKALMGYVLDGKNRILAIKNECGIPVARAIIKLLWDEGNKKPVLFLEKNYPQTLKPEFRKALETFAKNRAKELGLDLLTKGESSGRRVVVSLANKASYDYSDAAGGIQNGSYKISDCLSL